MFEEYLEVDVTQKPDKMVSFGFSFGIWTEYYY